MVEDTAKVVYFLGAGFTTAVAHQAPMGSEILRHAFNNTSLNDDNRIKTVKEFIDSVFYPIDDNHLPRIEDILSVLDYALQRKEPILPKYQYIDLLKIRLDLVYLIGTVIKESIESPGYIKKGLVDKFIETIYPRARCTIISTNYDIIIDNALLRKLDCCNYGALLRHTISVDLSEGGKAIAASPFPAYKMILNSGEIPLIKLHGSLNWFYCPKCSEVDITVGNKSAFDVINSMDPTKFLCASHECTSTYEPLLVTPTMMKIYDNPFLQKLWQITEKKISEASHVIFIGYSLSESDYHIRAMLIKALHKFNNVARIIVITKKPNNNDELRISNETRERYMQLFGHLRVSYHPISLQGFINQYYDILHINKD